MGETPNQSFRLSFNPALKVEFQGSRVTSDGGKAGRMEAGRRRCPRNRLASPRPPQGWGFGRVRMGLSGSRRARSALKIGLALSDGRSSGIQNGNLGRRHKVRGCQRLLGDVWRLGDRLTRPRDGRSVHDDSGHCYLPRNCRLRRQTVPAAGGTVEVMENLRE